ncbi:MAG: DUF3822 family protein [Bacteroidales bacterium]|jgi:hypothetical protein|nr:DUF3822 family protein [Bacteroidales bacterium]MDD2824012.1 DUF3822 family protein [Bacteroidales bacterium]MDD3101141.1 DUF3822 family protein [Bacteroidales bacterium]MDD3639931.1 DUF3822 family protein [Bacteroidales bacterium]MDD3944643.1 DUF3822 family protein [Bacteroidales bacterium]
MSAISKIPQAHHRLSIHIGVNGLSFVVEDTQTRECLLWRNYSFTFPGNDYNDWAKEVGNVFRQEDYLQKRFSLCNVMIDTHRHTLIPSSLFKPEQAVEVLKQLYDVAYLDEVNYSEISTLEATCIYALPAPVNATVFKYQHKARFYASVIPLLHFIMERKEFSRALLHYAHAHIDLVLMQGEKLLLCNSYAIDRFSTALYFLFFVLKQWQLNPRSLSLYVSGPLKPVHTKQLCTFFPSVTVATSETGLFPTEALNLQYGPHFFPVCAS